MPPCLIGLGSNLGDRRQLLVEALARLGRHSRIDVVACSRFRESEPIGGPVGQPTFLNAAAVLATSLSPRELLAELQQTEASLGRRCEVRWGPRTIDLDLLLYDGLSLNTPDLILPHPRLAWRRFVLEPAAEVAPEMLHPDVGWTIARLLQHLNTTPWYLAIAGPIGVGKSLMAGKIAENLGARLLAEEFDATRLEAFYRSPSSHAYQIELEFLERRGRQLASDRPLWSDKGRPIVSDFWFEQSPAFARVWLQSSRQAPSAVALAGGTDTTQGGRHSENADYHGAYESRLSELRSRIVRPRLTAMLHAPTKTMLERIRTRGRNGEETLTEMQLEALERSLRNQAVLPDRGPIVRLDAMNTDAAVTELVAAVEAMR